MKLNREEFILGAMFMLAFSPVTQLWAIILSPVTAILWALSGAGYPKLLRRFVVPFIACMMVYIYQHSWHIWIALPIAFGILSLGYGTPSTQPYDPGSKLGQWVYWKLSGQREGLASLITRTIIFSSLAITFILAINL